MIKVQKQPFADVLQELQIAFNHSPDNDSRDFINFYKKFTDLQLKIDDKIGNHKLLHDINRVNREAGKISALSSSKIDKYECLTVEAILPSNQSRIIEQGKFTYSPLGKDLEKQIKTIEDQGRKQVEALSFKTN